MSNKKELITQSQGYANLANASFGDAIAQELEGLDLSFERIKIPSGGSTMFEVPGENDDTDSVKEFSAVILYHHTLNTYYKSKYTGGNAPPDCSSIDGVNGDGSPGGLCKECPLNQWPNASCKHGLMSILSSER